MIKKKEKFIYWFIGLGCGMIISGMLMTYVGISIQTSERLATKNEEITHDVGQAETEETKSEDAVELEEPPQAQLPILQEALVDTDETYKWVNIPEYYHAKEISAFLEEENIVKNGKDFLEFLRANQMTTKLRCGKQYLPIEGKYDTILAILTGKQ